MFITKKRFDEIIAKEKEKVLEKFEREAAMREERRWLMDEIAKLEARIAHLESTLNDANETVCQCPMMPRHR